jgi:tetratricopeptide (TPR) repeat protein
MRGMQSAGLLVVKPIPPGSQSTVERIVDIRVDDAENPFAELRRLLQITEGVPNKLSEHAAELAKSGKFADAIAEQQKAIAITPNNEQLHYGLAERYAQAGRYREALKPLEFAIRRHAYFKRQAGDDPAFAKMKSMPEFERLIAP